MVAIAPGLNDVQYRFQVESVGWEEELAPWLPMTTLILSCLCARLCQKGVTIHQDAGVLVICQVCYWYVRCASDMSGVLVICQAPETCGCSLKNGCHYKIMSPPKKGLEHRVPCTKQLPSWLEWYCRLFCWTPLQEERCCYDSQYRRLLLGTLCMSLLMLTQNV